MLAKPPGRLHRRSSSNSANGGSACGGVFHHQSSRMGIGTFVAVRNSYAATSASRYVVFVPGMNLSSETVWNVSYSRL